MTRPWRPALLVVFLGLLAFAACQNGATPPATSNRDIGSPAEARAAVLHHWDAVRDALRARDGDTVTRSLSAVEAGRLYDADLLQLGGQLAERQEAHGEPPPRAPELKEVRVAISHQRRYPASFMALTSQPQTDAQGKPTAKLTSTFGVYRKTDPSTGWKEILETDLEDPSSLPALSLDPGGYATATVPAASSSVRPATLPGAYAQYLTSGLNGTPSASLPFASGTFTDKQAAKNRDQIKGWQESHARLQLQDTTAPPPADTYTYATTAGGYLAVFAIQEDGALSGEGAYCLLQATDRHQFGDAVRPGLYSRVTQRLLVTLAAHVPAAGGAPVRLLAYQESTDRVDSAPCY